MEDATSWTDSTCMTWGNPAGQDIYDALDSPEQFRRDAVDFPNRRHCLGHKRIGVDKIHADFYAGIFAGKNAGGEMYKMRQKFVATGSFYNIPFEIGKVSWMKTNDARAPFQQVK